MFDIYNYVHGYLLETKLDFSYITNLRIIDQTKTLCVSWEDNLGYGHVTAVNLQSVNCNVLPFTCSRRAKNRYEIFINPLIKNKIVPSFAYQHPAVNISLGTFASSCEHQNIYSNCIRYIHEINYNKPVFYFAQRLALHLLVKNWYQSLLQIASIVPSCTEREYLNKIESAVQTCNYNGLMNTYQQLQREDKRISYLFIYKVLPVIDAAIMLLFKLQVPIPDLWTLNRVLFLAGYTTEFKNNKLYIRKQDNELNEVDLQLTPKWLYRVVEKYC